MSDNSGVCAPELILFAKKPEPGKAKTRLIPALGPAEAARIAREMIERTAALAARAWKGPVRMACAPDENHPVFRELAERHGLILERQPEGDLGARMHAALEAGIARAGAAAIMGCDIPHCPESELQAAFDHLRAHRAVIGPAHDGGYWFIGLLKAEPRLFDTIAWGGPEVFAVTLERATASGLEFARLAVLRDIDTPEDLALS